jgi:hypothetical protein
MNWQSTMQVFSLESHLRFLPCYSVYVEGGKIISAKFRMLFLAPLISVVKKLEPHIRRSIGVILMLN